MLASTDLHPQDGNTTDGKPSGLQGDPVATTAAKALAVRKPGSFVVRAYLQLPSLKKAPPEVKKPSYKDESSDPPKSNKRSGRLSLFRSGQDSSAGAGTGDTRSPAKTVIAKGTVVQTFMGLATVRNVRSESGMSEVRVRVRTVCCFSRAGTNGRQVAGVPMNSVYDANCCKRPDSIYIYIISSSTGG